MIADFPLSNLTSNFNLLTSHFCFQTSDFQTSHFHLHYSNFHYHAVLNEPFFVLNRHHCCGSKLETFALLVVNGVLVAGGKWTLKKN